MGKEKPQLIRADMPLAMVESESWCFEVYAARWAGGGNIGEDCVVIEQERRKGSLGPASVFKMVVDPRAVDTIVEGLERYVKRSGHPSQYVDGEASAS